MVRTVVNRLAWVLLIVFPLSVSAQATRPMPQRPVPAIRHVVIISIDGLRPDVLLRADAPAIRSLMAHGSFTMWAHTTDVAITLPSHTSMVTGVSPRIHGITWNNDSKPNVYPKVPTLFEYAHQAGYSTALVAGKKKFETLAKPGTVDVLEIPVDAGAGANKKVELAAVKVILDHHPDVLMVHFPETDTVGHHLGWGTPEQVAAVATADHGVQAVVAALRQVGVYDSTLIIVTADHGGAGRGHGGLDPRSRNIPWIVSGPDIRENYDLTRDNKLVVNTTDTFATCMYVLGLPLPAYVEGKPVTDIFEKPAASVVAPIAAPIAAPVPAAARTPAPVAP